MFFFRICKYCFIERKRLDQNWFTGFQLRPRPVLLWRKIHCEMIFSQVFFFSLFSYVLWPTKFAKEKWNLRGFWKVSQQHFAYRSWGCSAFFTGNEILQCGSPELCKTPELLEPHYKRPNFLTALSVLRIYWLLL